MEEYRETFRIGCSAAEMIKKMGVKVFYCTRRGRVYTRNMFNTERPATMHEERLYRQHLREQLETGFD